MSSSDHASAVFFDVDGTLVATRVGPDPRSCGAVGDSRSDLPLFAPVGLSVAFNASAGAPETATVAVDGDDLRSVLPFLSRLVASTL
ncbi:hypothetical protein ACIQ9E_09525 [Streptomyces sp. NPDC094448]|uniref:hypothetical protein n=1 Tax=Streptomyces sp. NPDC094448 TaxID=3366063 RepID=UPI003806D6BB